jgi:hypothetical protein
MKRVALFGADLRTAYLGGAGDSIIQVNAIKKKAVGVIPVGGDQTSSSRPDRCPRNESTDGAEANGGDPVRVMIEQSAAVT